MDYRHVTVAFEEETVAAIERRLATNETVEDFVERAVAERFGSGETVDPDV